MLEFSWKLWDTEKQTRNQEGRNKMKILLIEDDKELGKVIAYQLRKENFEVDVCEDGEEGLYYMQ